MIEINGNQFKTLYDPIYVNQKKVLEVWANGVQVYPAYSKYFNNLSDHCVVIPFRNDYLWYNGYYPDIETKPYDTIFLYMKSSAESDIRKAAFCITDEMEGSYHVYKCRFYIKSTGRTNSYATYRMGNEGKLYIKEQNDDPWPPGAMAGTDLGISERIETYSENGVTYYIYRNVNAIKLARSFCAFERVSMMDIAIRLSSYLMFYTTAEYLKILEESERDGVDALHYTEVTQSSHYFENRHVSYVIGKNHALYTEKYYHFYDVLDIGSLYSSGIEVFHSEAEAVAYLKS